MKNHYVELRKTSPFPFPSAQRRMQTMLPILEQHAASAALLDEEDARRLARWAEVVPCSWETVGVKHMITLW